MPGVLWAFWVLVGLGTGSALFHDKQAGPVWDLRPDRSSRSGGRIAAPAPMTTISAPAYQIAQRDVYGREVCAATVVAVTGAGRIMRAVVGGVEQNIDSSWSVSVKAEVQQRRRVRVHYLDPVGGAEVACHDVGFTCIGPGWTGEPKSVLETGVPCIEAAGPQKGIDQTGGPRLVILPLQRVMANEYVSTSRGGFMVGTAVLVAEIRGQLNEDWWCPGVRWTFPQTEGHNPSLTTTSYEESDCGPYSEAAAQKQSRRLSKRVKLPEGRWEIRLELVHGDRVIATDTVVIEVGSSGEPFGNRDGGNIGERVEEPGGLRP